MEINKISIIVPVYNGANIISDCINSIISCEIDVPKELIIIDDGSTDDTGEIIKKFPCEYSRIEKSGVAKARNIAIKKAVGDILFFFDADVKLKKDTIKNFLKHFRKDNDAYIIQGRWDKNSYAPSFSSQFLLLKYHFNFEGLFYNTNRLAVAHLATGCLGIRKEVFNDFEGFNENYKRAGGEEHEFGLKLLKRYKIWYYNDIFVEHTFPSIFRNIKKVYFRTANFSMLVFNADNKEFVKLHRTTVPNQDKYSIAIILLIFLSFFMFTVNIKLGVKVFLGLIFLYLLNVRIFLLYLMNQKGFIFTIKGGISHFLIMIPRLLGLIKAGFIYYILRKKDYKT